MATAPQSRQHPHRTKHRARQGAAYSISPTPLDQRRYYDLKAGMSIPEIAARDNVTLAAVEKSLQRMRSYANQHSQEAAEIATRQLYLQRLPDANNGFEEALRATKIEARTELVKEYNILTEREEYVEKTILDHVPDHATRLKATEALQKLLSGVQPRTPLLAIDARSQTNIGLLGQGQPQSHSNALSFEAIARQVCIEQGKLPAESVVAEVRSEALPDVDMELADDLADDPEDDDDLPVGDGDDEDSDYAEDDDEDDDEEAGD